MMYVGDDADWDRDFDYATEAWEDVRTVDELYCDYCEREGHTFRACPARDDFDYPEDFD